MFVLVEHPVQAYIYRVNDRVLNSYDLTWEKQTIKIAVRQKQILLIIDVLRCMIVLIITQAGIYSDFRYILDTT